jgi:hypothetical protein
MLKKKKNALGLFRKNRSQEEKPSKPVEVRQEQGESQINRAVEFTASGGLTPCFSPRRAKAKPFPLCWPMCRRISQPTTVPSSPGTPRTPERR